MKFTCILYIMVHIAIGIKIDPDCPRDCDPLNFWSCTIKNSSMPLSNFSSEKILPRKPNLLLVDVIKSQDLRYRLNVYWFHDIKSLNILRGFLICLHDNTTNIWICNELTLAVTEFKELLLEPFNYSCFFDLKYHEVYEVMVCSLPTNSSNCLRQRLKISKQTRIPNKLLGSVQMQMIKRNLDVIMWAEGTCGTMVDVSLCKAKGTNFCDSSVDILDYTTAFINQTTNLLQVTFPNLKSNLYCITAEFVNKSNDKRCEILGVTRTEWTDNNWNTQLENKLYPNKSLELSFKLPGEWYEYSKYNITLYFTKGYQCLNDIFTTHQIEKPKNKTLFEDVPKGEYCVKIIPHNERINGERFICCNSEDEPIDCPAAQINLNNRITVSSGPDPSNIWIVIIVGVVTIIIIMSFAILRYRIKRIAVIKPPKIEDIVPEPTDNLRITVLCSSDTKENVKHMINELRTKISCKIHLPMETMDDIVNNLATWIMEKVLNSNYILLVHSPLAEDLYNQLITRTYTDASIMFDHIFYIFLNHLLDREKAELNRKLIHIHLNSNNLTQMQNIGGEVCFFLPKGMDDLCHHLISPSIKKW